MAEVGGYVLLVVAAVWAPQGYPHKSIESNSGDLRSGDSYPRTVEATATKPGVLINHEAGFNPIFSLRVPFYGRARAERQKGCKRGKHPTAHE